MILLTKHVAQLAPGHGCVRVIEMSTSAAIRFCSFAIMLFGQNFTIKFRVCYSHFIVAKIALITFLAFVFLCFAIPIRREARVFQLFVCCLSVR